METIDNYPKTSIHAFTDGSAFKATTFAGFGVFLRIPGRPDQCLSEPCGNVCSNYSAEIKGMITAVKHVTILFEKGEVPPKDLVVFTDSLSALEALEAKMDKNNDIQLLAKCIDTLHKKFSTNIKLQWIPGHSGVYGNEKADKLAKEGAGKEQENIPVDQNTIKIMLKNNSKEEWNERWAKGTTGRVMYQEMSKPSRNDPINYLDRADQCLIFRLRTGHIQLNAHLNRTNPTHEPHCRNCSHPYETVSHVLFECPRLLDERKRLLPPLPSLHNTLYLSKEQLIKTCKFIRLAMNR